MTKLSLNIVIISFFFNLTTFGQSGYLGSLDAIGVHINCAPSLQRTAKFDLNEDGDTARFAPLRIATPSFSLSYARVFTRKIELGLTYSYTPIRTFSKQARITKNEGGSNLNNYLLEDLRGAQHSVNLELRYYRRGSLAPTGKYLGLSIVVGGIAIFDDEVTPVGISNSSSSTFFKEEFEVFAVYDQESIKNTKGNFFSIRGVIGRNFPIADKLMINFSTSFPLISSYRNQRRSTQGFRFITNDVNTTRIEEGDFGDIFNYTMHKYNRIILSLGLRFQI